MYPDAMIKGQKYVLTNLTKEVSQFKNKKGEFPSKLVAHFKNLYMGIAYDNLDEKVFESIKTDIQNKKAPSVVYYGKLGTTNELYILGHDEGNTQIL